MQVAPGAVQVNLDRKEGEMPDYIWQFVCQNALPDGEYEFPEGTLVIINGFAGWKPAQS